MKEKVRNYAKGIFESVGPEVELSTNHIMESVFEGQNYEGSFSIISTNGEKLSGNVEVYHKNVTITSGNCTDTEYEVNYQVLARNLTPSEKIEGEFNIVTNGGEFQLPYSFEVVKQTLPSSLGGIKDLFQFTNLAKEKWEEALRLFHSEQFSKVMFPKDCQQKRVYEELKRSSSPNQSLEEFLVYIHKKKSIQLKPIKSEIKIIYDKEDISSNLYIEKNEWGFFQAELQVNSEIIFLPKTRITKDDFVGKTCEIPFVVDISKCKKETEVVYIEVNNVYQKFQVKVTIQSRQMKPVFGEEEKRAKQRMIHQYQRNLLADYLDFRVEKLALEDYTKQTIENTSYLIKVEVNPNLYRLIRLNMYLLCQDKSRIKQEFAMIEQNKESVLVNDLLICYYDYLMCMYHRDSVFIAKTVDILKEKYEEEKHQFYYFWILMYLDQSYLDDRSSLYEGLQEQYLLGNRSPVLFYEVCDLWNHNQALLKQLGNFELSCVWYGLKHQFLSEEVKSRILAFASQEKVYRKKIFDILTWLYKEDSKDEILHQICALLIKGRMVEQQYHIYFEKAIDHHFKLIGLPEYFMKSMDFEDYTPLPQMVQLYFAADNHKLSDSEMAYLYANIVFHKEENSEIYLEYKDHIEQFIVTQIEKGRINEHLALLYDEFFEDQLLMRQVASFLPNIIFKRKISVPNPNMQYVVVHHSEFEEERKVPLKNGTAYIDVVTEHCVISLLDAHQNRYISTIPYRMEEILDAKLYLRLCYEADPSNDKIMINLVHNAEQAKRKDYDLLQIWKQLYENKQIEVSFRKKMLGNIIHFYYEEYEGDILENYLLHIDMHHLLEEDRNQAVQYMVVRRLYELAFEVTKEYGFDMLTTKQILKIVSYMLEKEHVDADPLLLKMCFEVFHDGRYNETIIRYLMAYGQGSMGELLPLWEAASKLQFDTSTLEERIIEQAIETSCFPPKVFDVFMQYDKGNKQSMLLDAFYNYQAFRYLIYDDSVKKDIFIQVCHTYEKREYSDLVLAATLFALSKRQGDLLPYKECIGKIVQYFWEKGVIFPFFKAFASLMKIPKELYVKSYVVYRDKPNKNIRLHYCMDKTKIKPADYEVSIMKEVVQGYYIAEFVLFGDEDIYYYIEEVEQGSNAITSSDSLSLYSFLNGRHDSRFEMINTMIASRELEDEQELLETMELYIRNVEIIDSYFTMI